MSEVNLGLNFSYQRYRAQLRWFSSGAAEFVQRLGFLERGLIAKEEARVSKDVEKRLLRSKVGAKRG